MSKKICFAFPCMGLFGAVSVIGTILGFDHFLVIEGAPSICLTPIAIGLAYEGLNSRDHK